LQESEHRSAQLRTQRELEALQSLSQSLANENKGLREERAELEERIGELREKASAKNGRGIKWILDLADSHSRGTN
jgi:regulator of replication initiation timing